MLPRLIVAVVAAVALALPVPIALGQPGVAFLAEKRFEAADPPDPAEVLQAVLDFAPGAWTPLHTHTGPGYATVLEGEMTLRKGGADQKFRAGEGWIDSPNEPHMAGNDGPTTSRIVATFVLPRGATPTTVVGTGAASDLPSGPATFSQLRFDAPGLPRPLDVVQRMIEVAPGAQVPMHSHPGPTIATALEGSGTFAAGGTTQTIGAGQSWIEPANQVHGRTVTGTGPIRIVATSLVPRGLPDTVPAAAPATQIPARLPRTGDVPMGSFAAALLGLFMLVGGALLRRS